MKKLFTLILALTTVGITSAVAQEFAMRKAIEKLLHDKNITIVQKTANEGQENGKVWKVQTAAFEISAECADKLAAVVASIEKDKAHRGKDFYLSTSQTNMTYSVKYSEKKEIRIGYPDTKQTVAIISGTEREGVNTVCAIEFRPRENDENSIIGQLHIIERDPYFPELAAETKSAKKKILSADGELEFTADNITISSESLTDANQSENLRRLNFYAIKYMKEAKQGGGATIVKAIVFVVSDIIQNGTEEDKTEAKKFIDMMIMATPDPNSMTMRQQQETVKENSKTLLNLLSRLNSKSEYSAMESTPNTFRINGKIDEGLWDIGYYISTSDETMDDPTHNPELVKAEGQTFHYQTELDAIRLGRVRALFKDGTVCSAWIELLFVPGETAELTVHNGTYSLEGTGFYKDWNEARKKFAWAGGPSSMRGDKREKAFLDILRKNSNRPAYFVYAFKEKILRFKETRQKAYDLLPDETKQSPYGVFLRRYL